MTDHERENPEQERVIQNISCLDLTGMKGADDLARIAGIRNVATILVPESLSGKLMSIPMENVAMVVPVPEGSNVKLHTGQLTMTGEAFANEGGDPDSVFVIVGQLIITSPIPRIGYKQLMVTGQLLAPKESQAVLAAGLTKMMGQVMYYTGSPRFFNGDERLGAGFFELVDEPITLLVNGRLTLEEEVTADLLKSRVSGISLNGVIVAPRALLPLVQFLTTEKNGEIKALEDEPREDPAHEGNANPIVAPAGHG